MKKGRLPTESMGWFPLGQSYTCTAMVYSYMYERADFGGVQYAGSLRIAHPFETVSKCGCVGYYIEKCRLLQNGGWWGNSRDGVGMYAGGPFRSSQDSKVWGRGVYHRTDCMQAASGGVDGGAGDPDR